MDTKDIDSRIEIASRMMKAAGRVTPKDLSEAALICIQLAAQIENPQAYFAHVELKVKEGILTHNAELRRAAD